MRDKKQVVKHLFCVEDENDLRISYGPSGFFMAIEDEGNDQTRQVSLSRKDLNSLGLMILDYLKNNH